jgi:hypothetical protein
LDDTSFPPLTLVEILFSVLATLPRKLLLSPLPLLLATDMFSSKFLDLLLDDDTNWLGTRDNITCPLLWVVAARRLDFEIDKASALLKQITAKATTMAAPPVVLPIII